MLVDNFYKAEECKYKDFYMTNLLLAIGMILAVLWLLGLITSYTFGGAVHILLIFAAVAIVIWAVKRKR